MPLLRGEPDTFPFSILELDAEDFPWWVAHVRSRQEKALARYLRPREVPFYLPQHEHRKRRAGRNFVSYLPLFPGYLFFRGSSEQRLTVLRSDLLVRVLDVPDQALLTDELAQIRSLQEAGASFVRLPEFVPGDAVKVTEGPFEGYTGVVLRNQARTRLVISISMLRQAVAVEFSREVLAPLVPSRWFDQSRSAVGF